MTGCLRARKIADALRDDYISRGINDDYLNRNSFYTNTILSPGWEFANIHKDKNAVCAMNPIGGDGEVAAGGKSGLVYALKGAVVGAAAGYGYSKFA